MISEFFINIIFNLVTWMFELLPEVSWSVDSSAFEYFLGIVRVASYVFPVGTVSQILGIVVDFMIFRIIISIVRMIWDIFPLL